MALSTSTNCHTLPSSSQVHQLSSREGLSQPQLDEYAVKILAFSVVAAAAAAPWTTRAREMGISLVEVEYTVYAASCLRPCW